MVLQRSRLAVTPLTISRKLLSIVSIVIVVPGNLKEREPGHLGADLGEDALGPRATPLSVPTAWLWWGKTGAVAGVGQPRWLPRCDSARPALARAGVR